MDYLFYDIEVFKYDSLVVFKNIDNKVVYKCWNKQYSQEDIDTQPYIKRNSYFDNGFNNVQTIIENKTLVGYNNHYYDDIILATMINRRPQNEIKQNNDWIIAGKTINVPTPERNKAKTITSLDCFQQIDLSMPSLKLIEGNMGKSIIESEVNFNIDRPLTDKEKAIVEEYCEYDVENTIEVFKKRKESYFDIRKQLDDMMQKDFTKWNTTTQAATILCGNNKTTKWSKIGGFKEEWVKEFKELQPDVWDMWSKWKPGDKGKSIKVEECGCEIVFGFGGLHGVHAKRKKFGKTDLLDVGSMYPTIILNINGLGDSTALYDDIRKERLSIKHTDPVKASALKLILNSVYGLLKNQYSVLYNPYVSTSVCVYGQIALYDLCRKLYEAGYTIVNINTDGVAFVDEMNVGNRWQGIQQEWEQKFSLSLELDSFDRWWQRDVNNYVALQGDYIKTKGGDVNKYHGEGKLFSNNNARIIQIAIVDYLMKDIPPMKTILNNRDKPSLYQYILRVGSTFKGVIDEQNNTDYNKVNRVFPVKRGIEHTRLYKHRADGAKVLFPDSPERMMVWNDDVMKIDDFKDKVDTGHFYNIVSKKLEQWKE